MATADPTIAVQALLRILSTTAKLPLSTSLKLVKPLHAADLTADTLATAKPAAIQSAIAPALSETDDVPKLAKQISAAAKRTASKAKAGAGGAVPCPSGRKRKRIDDSATPSTQPLSQAPTLLLPAPRLDEAQIRQTALHTNRAPLLLAFAVVLLKHTMPAQPEDSRLSLAHAMVSQGASARARELGIQPAASKDAGALQDRAGQGYRRVTVMSSEIAVLRRAEQASLNVDTASTQSTEAEAGRVPATQYSAPATKAAKPDTSNSSADDLQATQSLLDPEPAYWALDLNAASTAHHASASGALPPIHTPQAAQAYLLKSFASAADKTTAAPPSAAEREGNLALLLGALELLFDSWSRTLAPSALNARAWSWYVSVRPAVAEGRAGWGGKGTVRLDKILAMRREEA